MNLSRCLSVIIAIMLSAASISTSAMAAGSAIQNPVLKTATPRHG